MRLTDGAIYRASDMMAGLGKTLIYLGIVIVIVGVLLSVCRQVAMAGPFAGRHPIQRERFTFHFPLTTCIVVSVIISLVLYFFKGKICQFSTPLTQAAADGIREPRSKSSKSASKPKRPNGASARASSSLVAALMVAALIFFEVQLPDVSLEIRSAATSCFSSHQYQHHSARCCWFSWSCAIWSSWSLSADGAFLGSRLQVAPGLGFCRAVDWCRACCCSRSPAAC